MASELCKIKKYIEDVIDQRLADLESASGLALPVSLANGGTAGVNAAQASVNLTPASVDLSGITAINWAASRTFYDTLTANKTYTFTGANDGLPIQVKVTNGASWTMTFPAVTWLCNGGAAPAAPASGKFKIMTLTNIGGVLCGVYTDDSI